MSPVLVAGIATAALLIGGLIGYLLARSRHERAMEQLAGDLQNTVGLYIRRKVAEAGIDPSDALQAGSPESALRANGTLAAALLQQDRQQFELGDTQELGLARTMRLKSTSELEPVDESGSPTAADTLET